MLKAKIRYANLAGMTKARTFLLVVIFTLEGVMSGSIPANASDNIRVDELFTALRDGKFSEATAHFDSTMKAALSADQLSAVWLQIVAADGKLENWKVLSHGILAGTDVSSVVLAFDHGKVMATVAVRPQTGEISGLYFRPLTTQPSASSPATSPPYADATKFRSEAVTVGKDPWKLSGILTIPVGDSPFPAVVLLAGSGPQDRDETIGPNHVFKDLAEGLSTRGIVVLRYDKRTYAYKTLDPQTTTVKEEVIDDGAAGLDCCAIGGKWRATGFSSSGTALARCWRRKSRRQRRRLLESRCSRRSAANCRSWSSSR